MRCFGHLFICVVSFCLVIVHPETDHGGSEPVQGPVAPPQRQGLGLYFVFLCVFDTVWVFFVFLCVFDTFINYAFFFTRTLFYCVAGAPLEYIRFGSCDKVCQHCGALFWLEERRSGVPASAAPQYQKCCAGGRVVLRTHSEYPAYIMDLFSNRHFIDNIRAYNQMFAMTSFGATVDSSVNRGGGPYVFRVSGQIYHWIGGFCPSGNDDPRFLQMYIYDTDHEIQHRLSHFNSDERRILQEEIVEGLMRFLNEHNALVRLFRTARDKLQQADIPDFEIRLFGVVGANQYELPTADTIGAIVYDGGPETTTQYDVVIQRHSGEAESVNKLHPAYMALQFPVLFIYGEQGYHLNLRLRGSGDTETQEQKRMTMKAYYAYQLCDRIGSYNLITRAGRLFQQYIVNAYCVVEQARTDFIRYKQNEIRTEYLSGIYDAITRGDRSGRDVGSRIILPASFTGGPRYMYSHYLDALAICRVHGNPSFFVTFTCNAKWPEIQEYMNGFPLLNTSDRPDIVDRVFERKIHRLIKFIRDERIFGNILAGELLFRKFDGFYCIKFSIILHIIIQNLILHFFFIYLCSSLHRGISEAGPSALPYIIMDSPRAIQWPTAQYRCLHQC